MFEFWKWEYAYYFIDRYLEFFWICTSILCLYLETKIHKEDNVAEFLLPLFSLQCPSFPHLRPLLRNLALSHLDFSLPLLRFPCSGFKPWLVWSRIVLLMSPPKRRLVSRRISRDLIPSYRSHTLNKYIQRLPMERSPDFYSDWESWVRPLPQVSVARGDCKGSWEIRRPEFVTEWTSTRKENTDFVSQSRPRRD